MECSWCNGKPLLLFLLNGALYRIIFPIMFSKKFPATGWCGKML